MYQLMTRGEKLKIFPYDEIEEIQQFLDKKIAKLSRYGQWSEDMIELIKGLLVANPRKRWTAKQAIDCAWLK